MALTGAINLPSTTGNTPVPYRVSTDAVRLPKPVDTSALLAIRAEVRERIEPRTGWWQFELRPWMYWTAIGAAFLITGAFIALLVHTSAVR